MQRRTKAQANKPDYQQLEPRQLLATFVVNTLTDAPGNETDGFVSLREALTAANTNQAFGDAASGEADAIDEITFDYTLFRWRVNEAIQLTAGPLTISEGVSISAAPSHSRLTIDAQGQSRVFEINSPDPVTLHNLHLTNGRADDGGGLEIVDTDVELNFISVSHSRATNGNGGGIYLSNGSIAAESLIVSENVAGGMGGGIFLENSSLSTDIYARVKENFASGAGGGIAGRSSDLFLSHMGIWQNVSAGNGNSGGGGLYLDGDSNAVLASETGIHSNRATRGHGGGIYFRSSGTLQFTDNARIYVTSNYAAGNGGGVHVSGGSLLVSNGANDRDSYLSFYGNSAARNGGGISLVNESDVDIYLLSMSANIAGTPDTKLFGLGGGIFATNSDLRFHGDRAHITGEAFHAGGGLALIGGSIEVDAGETWNEDSATGYGYFSSPTLFGGWIAASADGVRPGLNNSTEARTGEFTGGGAVSNLGGHFEARDSYFANNVSATNGGAFLNSLGQTTLRTVQLRDNQAGENGGAIYNDAQLHVFDSFFVDNEAVLAGGAIFDTPDADTTLMRTHFEDDS